MFAAVCALVVEHKVSRSRNRRHNLRGVRVLSPHQFTRAHLRASACQTPPMAHSGAASAVGAAARGHTVGMGREGARARTEKVLSRWRYASPSSAGHHPYCPSSSSFSGRAARGCRVSLNLRSCPRARTHAHVPPTLIVLAAAMAAVRGCDSQFVAVIPLKGAKHGTAQHIKPGHPANSERDQEAGAPQCLPASAPDRVLCARQQR
jgi:hypothetical protein